MSPELLPRLECDAAHQRQTSRPDGAAHAVSIEILEAEVISDTEEEWAELEAGTEVHSPVQSSVELEADAADRRRVRGGDDLSSTAHTEGDKGTSLDRRPNRLADGEVELEDHRQLDEVEREVRAAIEALALD